MTDQDLDNIINADDEMSGVGSDSSIETDFVDTDEDGNPATQKDTTKKLREALKIAIEEKQKYLDGWQRDKAEFINIRKRDELAKKELVQYANERLVDDLIPVLQNFDLAFQNKEAWEKVDKNWRTGVEFIYSHLKQTLEGNGLEEINPQGLPFDPMRDDAIEHVSVSDKKDDHAVVEVVQKGYKLNGKIIRPARVKVGEFKTESVN